MPYQNGAFCWYTAAGVTDLHAVTRFSLFISVQIDTECIITIHAHL